MRKTGIIILGLMFVISLAGCQESDKLTYGKPVKRPETVDISEQNEIVTDFAVRLLQNTYTGEENVLLSPVSILSGLSLIANGADGESLAQIEEVVGMSAEEMNAYLYSYTHQLSENWDTDNKLHVANSLWINKEKNITVSDEFLKKNEMYHDASIFYTEFDQSCVEDTNKWIREQTDGKVSEIINEIPEDAGMYLANSLVYEGLWAEKVSSYTQSDFTRTFAPVLSGNEEFSVMYERESVYFEDIAASGFMKYFAHGKYGFVVLLPNEDQDIKTYIQNLTGERLYRILSNPIQESNVVGVWMPLFALDYETNMKDVLRNMGVREILDKEKADFSLIDSMQNDESIQIDAVFYKNCMNLNINGINTDKENLNSEEGYALSDLAPYNIFIDCPFISMVIDCEHKIPLLIGVVNCI